LCPSFYRDEFITETATPGDLLLLKDEKMLSSFLFSTGSVLEIIPELFFTDCCANEMIVNITEKR